MLQCLVSLLVIIVIGPTNLTTVQRLYRSSCVWLVLLVFKVLFTGGPVVTVYIIAELCRMVFNQHAIFCVYSLAHYLGDTSFDDYHTPKNSWITATVIHGEGYHKFHHQFPQNYRNAILWFQYNLTKWFLNDKKWVLWGDIFYDVEKFDHPGGSNRLAVGIYKDMTKSFNSGIYNHSNGARNLLSTMRVGVLKYAIIDTKPKTLNEKCVEFDGSLELEKNKSR